MSAYGQAIVTTAAGGGFISNAPALQVYLDNPNGVAVDASGNVYIAELSHILRVDHTTGILTAVAGAGPTIYSMTDGPALSVRIAPTSPVVNASVLLVLLPDDAGKLSKCT